jgi:hypothetical protein
VRLKNNDGYIKKRQRTRILRYKRYNSKIDPWNHFRVELMLFLPWLNEENEIEIEDTFKKFEENKLIIAENRKLFESVVVELYDQEVERIEKEIEDHYYYLNEKNASDLSKIHTKLIDQDKKKKVRKNNSDASDGDAGNSDENEELEDNYGYHAYLIDPVTNLPRKTNEIVNVTRPKRLRDEEYFKLMSNLNLKQQIYSKLFLHRFKNNEQVLDFVRGGSGTGKSFLIQSIYQTVLRYLQKNNDEQDNSQQDENLYENDDDIVALIGAYTGKASYNIRGDTLFRLFHLPTRTKYMSPLSGSVLEKVTKQYSKLKLIIIDEISLVGNKLFTWINERLQQIKIQNYYLVVFQL